MPNQSNPGSAKTRGFSFRLFLLAYQVGWLIALPLALTRLWWRGKKEPGYRKHILERLGFYPRAMFTQKPVWIHAVSVGETRASAPLVHALLERGECILLTHMTPTGRRTGTEIFKQQIESGKLVQAYLPYDFSWPVKHFYRHFSPKMGAVMETEAWPTLVFVAQKLGLPLYLVNGRLSERSAGRIERFGSLGKELFQSFYQILAQTQSDAHRYLSLGVQDCQVTGNLKFDVDLPHELVEQGITWKKQYFQNRFVVCAASTREGEEALILQAWTKIKSPQALLFIIPRHPQRFQGVATLIQAFGLTFVRRSALGLDRAFNEDVVLCDSMGEMPLYLAASDFVVMGGSLLEFGGQNLIEPCSLGKPVILGQYTYNFHQASEDAINAGAAWRLSPSSTQEELIENLSEFIQSLLNDQSAIDSASESARKFSEQFRGATAKTLMYLEKSLLKR